jgi:hypothetical protein
MERSADNLIIECTDKRISFVRQWYPAAMVVVGMSSVVALLVIAIILNLPGQSILAVFGAPVLILSILVGIFVSGYWRQVRRKRQIRHATQLDEDAVVHICTPGWWDIGLGDKSLIREIAARGMVGRCIRICHESDRFEAAPLKMAFEPVPLDEADASFSNLEQQSENLIATVGERADAETLRRLRKNVQLSGGKFYVAILACAVLFHVIQSLRNLQLSTGALFWSVLLVATVFGYRRGATTARSQAFLVPAGLFHRRLGFIDRRWQSHLFQQSESVLLLRLSYGGLWHLSMADVTHAIQTAITRKEAQMLIRAWLSPLPAPSFERISDLASSS